MRILFATLFAFLLLPFASGQNDSDSQAVDSANAYFSPLKWRNIGPFRGGRSVTSCGVIGDPLTYYMGTTGGGLWKTEDAGQVGRDEEQRLARIELHVDRELLDVVELVEPAIFRRAAPVPRAAPIQAPELDSAANSETAGEATTPTTRVGTAFMGSMR